MLELKHHSEIMIHQKKELAELFGFETRNKYQVVDTNKQTIGFVAEQGKGFFNFLGRFLLGHWRTFELHLFDAQRNKVAHAHHPFRWFFKRLDFYDLNNLKIGALQERFSLLSKKFELEDAYGQVLLKVSSPIWRIWTFKFLNLKGVEHARIEKKWSGLLKEAFTDADNFKLTFNDSSLDNKSRNALVMATVFIDLQYFEKKANS